MARPGRLMSITKAVAISIQAVSPVSNLGACSSAKAKLESNSGIILVKRRILSPPLPRLEGGAVFFN
jgi:hypothetical protein